MEYESQIPGKVVMYHGQKVSKTDKFYIILKGSVSILILKKEDVLKKEIEEEKHAYN